MPFVEMERKRDFLTDDVMQVTWYMVYGSVHEQKNVLIYKMIPHIMNGMNLNYGEILWIPCPTNFDEADYKRDSLEILDGIEKLSEFNVKLDAYG